MLICFIGNRILKEIMSFIVDGGNVLITAVARFRVMPAGRKAITRLIIEGCVRVRGGHDG